MWKNRDVKKRDAEKTWPPARPKSASEFGPEIVISHLCLISSLYIKEDSGAAQRSFVWEKKCGKIAM